MLVLLSLKRSFLKGSRDVSEVDLHKEGMSWVASRFSGGGRPSGMVSNLKELWWLRVAEPCDLRKRWWLNSVLTKVIWKPLEWRILANFSMGLMWPCAGKGMHTA